jgi:hypothetical protein
VCPASRDRLLGVHQRTARANSANALKLLGVLDEPEAWAETEVGLRFRSAEVTATEHILNV